MKQKMLTFSVTEDFHSLFKSAAAKRRISMLDLFVGLAKTVIDEEKGGDKESTDHK